MKFVILSNEESLGLIKDINNVLDNKYVTEYRLVSKGFGAGLWRKVLQNSSLNSSYSFMNLRGKPIGRSSEIKSENQFLLCLTENLNTIAAVHYARSKINNIIRFPNGNYTEWQFLWKSYHRLVKEHLNECTCISVLKPILTDSINNIAKFILPAWFIRVRRVSKKNEILFC